MTATEYMPTTSHVREDFAYPWDGFKQYREARLAAFDRWLADHDAHIRAEARAAALQEAQIAIAWEDDVENPDGGGLIEAIARLDYLIEKEAGA